MLKLTDSQRAEIVDLLEQGKDLPGDYKHLLFPPERQEYELVYAGKEREEDILAETMAVPLQPIRTFGDSDAGWRNLLILGDNLQAMKTLLKMKEQGQLVNADGTRGVRLVYIDPPFATKQEFRSGQDERAYQDRISGATFLEFLRKRFVLMRELLTQNGLLYVHLDYRKVHYAKALLDEVFGEHNFMNDISWCYSERELATRHWNRKHDTILVYARDLKTDLHVFNWQEASGQYSQGTFKKYQHQDEDGRPFQLRGRNVKDSPWRGKHGIPLDVEKEHPEWVYRDYLDQKKGIRPRDWWTDIPFLNRAAGDRYDYPSAKNPLLLERIIRVCSNAGDVVLDAFAGSGTTLAVAERLGRRWIGIDCGKLAIYTTQKRLLNLKAEIGNKGKSLKPQPFTVCNAGLYDFARLKELPWDGWRATALMLFQCQDSPHKVAGIELDGYRNGDDVLVFNYRQGGGVVLDYGFIDDLHSQIGSRLGAQFFIIAPAASVTFLEDYIEKGRIRYYILRIPYSIVNELHNRDFSALLQPADETKVNETVEAVGFDFIRQPKVECRYLIRLRPDQLLKDAVVKIITFKSQAMAKGASQRGNLETLSMVLVDYDYPYDPTRKGKEPPPPFELDAVFYAGDIQAADWEVRLPPDSLGSHVMLIYLDIYGNEYTEIKAAADFAPVEAG